MCRVISSALPQQLITALVLSVRGMACNGAGMVGLSSVSVWLVGRPCWRLPGGQQGRSCVMRWWAWFSCCCCSLHSTSTSLCGARSTVYSIVIIHTVKEINVRRQDTSRTINVRVWRQSQTVNMSVVMWLSAGDGYPPTPVVYTVSLLYWRL